MTGIAGIAAPGRQVEVESMLQKLSHRGKAGSDIFQRHGITLGAVQGAAKASAWDLPRGSVQDETGPGRFARAQATFSGLVLERDPLGASPLYLGELPDGTLAFASEVKALLGMARGIRALPPGHRWQQGRQVATFQLEAPPLREAPPEVLASDLRKALEAAVGRAMEHGMTGSWLSGGLDSSVLVALASPFQPRFHTFAGGLAQAEDLTFAREVAEHVGTLHHEVVLTPRSLQKALPEVVASLESFDALLVRSSVVNHLVAQAAADYVEGVFSGEGGDELFAGYNYLKDLPLEALPAELLDITGRLHNTALQRVDRSASRHGLAVHTCFLDPEVVAHALAIPARYKIHQGVEKWILRRALDGALPAGVLERPKAKFWEGSGVAGLLAEHAEHAVTDDDFRLHRKLANGWVLHSKEEMVNYRHFREAFGDLDDLSWMGRTKGQGPEA